MKLRVSFEEEYSGCTRRHAPDSLRGRSARYADAVVSGDAEGVWPKVIADAQAGRLSGIYRMIPPAGCRASSGRPVTSFRGNITLPYRQCSYQGL
jgi:hypothetical protein